MESSDRFFSDAEVSVTGHSWTSGAIATDYNERTWHADYDEGIRGRSRKRRSARAGSPASRPAAEAEDELEDPEGGYLFEAFGGPAPSRPPSAGPGKLSMAIYGEGTAKESGDMSAYQAPGWKDGDIRYFDTCRAKQFIDG